VRRYAVSADTTASNSNNASALYMDAPPAPKVQSLVKMVPYAGKRKPITPVSYDLPRYNLDLC